MAEGQCFLEYSVLDLHIGGFLQFQSANAVQETGLGAMYRSVESSPVAHRANSAY